MNFLIVFLILTITQVQTIENTCNLNVTCPSNSQCNYSNDYCQCEPGFIGSCNTTAIQITQKDTKLVLNSQNITYLYIQPAQVDKFLEFTFSVCQNQPRLDIIATVWMQTGTISDYNDFNSLFSPNSIILQKGCTSIMTSFMKFSMQINGQKQMLVVGLIAESGSATIEINVTQRIIMQIFIYYYLMIAFVTIISVITIVSLAIFVFKRRMRNRAARTIEAPPVQENNNIEFFDKFMPSSMIDKKIAQEAKICPICIQQFDKKDYIRMTPCTHVFHALCLDAWCAKILNCPVCRTELSLNKFEGTTQTPSKHITNRNEGYQSNWAEQIDDYFEQEITNDHPGVRQTML